MLKLSIDHLIVCKLLLLQRLFSALRSLVYCCHCCLDDVKRVINLASFSKLSLTKQHCNAALILQLVKYLWHYCYL